jgi:adenylosuccinate lyase
MSDVLAAVTSTDEVFSAATTQGVRMEVEVALARVQARRGIIPAAAAEEIARTANLAAVSPDAVAAETRKVGHPMVALLDVWAGIAADGAGEWLHFGATSADIFDTTFVLQTRRAVQLFAADLRRAEAALLRLAAEHRATPMIGRTVGRHALPITFGLKCAEWAAENRRNIERLKAWRARTGTGMLSGAVGSYASLGPDALAQEAEVMAELGLDAPWPADWKGSRDMFAEYGMILALIATTWANIAQDIFILQGDDIRELAEPSGNVGSSTMPHKQNPWKSRRILALARVVPRQAEVLRDWMVSIYERDQISSADTLGEITATAGRLIKDAADLMEIIEVRPDAMRANLARTGGLIMAERAMLLLGPRIGKHTAHHEVRFAAAAAWENGTALVDEIAARPGLARHATELDLAHMLDPLAYTGQAPAVADRTVAAIEAARGTDAAALA